jgi:hypothetical protein
VNECMPIRYEKLLCDYIFSNKTIEDFDISQQEIIRMGKDFLTMHGAGGKIMEKLLIKKFKFGKDDAIHGWDAWYEFRPIEMKTETINTSKKIYCEASYPSHTKNSKLKKDVYLEEKPYLVSCGICDKTGKCLYVMITDTTKIKKTSKFFQRLSANAPRINFGHIKDDVGSYEFLYKNETLIQKNIIHIHKKFKDTLLGLQTKRKST